MLDNKNLRAAIFAIVLLIGAIAALIRGDLNALNGINDAAQQIEFEPEVPAVPVEPEVEPVIGPSEPEPVVESDTEVTAS